MEIKERMMLNVKLHEIKENYFFSFLKHFKYYDGDRPLGSNFQKIVLWKRWRERKRASDHECVLVHFSPDDSQYFCVISLAQETDCAVKA